MQAKILSQAKEEMTKTQREYFLREQMKAIRSELGETDEREEEVKDLRKRIKKAQMPREIEKEAKKQVERLEMMHPDAIESSMLGPTSSGLSNCRGATRPRTISMIKNVKAILDEDHYDLEKVKERILEFLSVIKLKGRDERAHLMFCGAARRGEDVTRPSHSAVPGEEFHRGLLRRHEG